MGCIRSAKQEQGEPVAWMDKENHDVIVSAKDWDNIDPLWYWMYQPLYTTPQPAPQRSEDTTQKKPWVGLTDDEIEMIVENRRAAHWEFIRQVDFSTTF